jgi:tetratricopeptide (TPR) repeat protein
MRNAILLVLLSANVATAQIPDKFTNLKVLPKDISKEDLSDTMRRFSFSLGVRCQFCHVGADSPTLAGADFASDDKEAKRTARTMLQMVDAINRDYVGKLGKAAPVPVDCVTCHRGLSIPRTLIAVLNEELDKGGAAGAVASYQALRKKYYGRGAYDFSETSLNQLAESLLKAKKTKEAVAIMELNAEVNPITGWGYSVLAMSHQANGDLEEAKTDFQKILELQPQNAWAKQQLEELQKRKR